MDNQSTNIEICEKLIEFFKRPENKNLRFFQALSNMKIFENQYDDRLNVQGIDDPYYYENRKIIKKIDESKTN